MAEQEKPQGPGSGTSDEGANAVGRAAGGAELKAGEERSALDWLLGAPEPARYTVEAEYDTPAGLKPLKVNFTAMDGSKLDKIEQSHISERTGVMDKGAADAELFIEAVTTIEDPDTGKSVKVGSEEFRTIKPGEPALASAIDALHVRFKTQPGVVAGVARAIREAAGWAPDRVGKASRVLVDAAGN